MSSKRRIRRRSCESKNRYNTYGEAAEHARRLSRAKGARWSAYKCSFCGGYHFGRMSQRQKQSMIARQEARSF